MLIILFFLYKLIIEMNIIISQLLTPQIITQDIVFKCVSSLSTSILSTYNLYNFIVSNSNSDYQIYQSQITSTDLANKLLLASSLIKDIVKKHHFAEHSDLSINEIMKMYDTNVEEEIKVIHDSLEEFNIISFIQSNKIISNIPEPVKIVLYSTLEIIDKINNILNTIHIKIKNHAQSYIKYVSKLNIHLEVEQLIGLDKIFDMRLNLLLNVLKIYSDSV
jgi:hypothetical protein